jgi:hypothetical protein
MLHPPGHPSLALHSLLLAELCIASYTLLHDGYLLWFVLQDDWLEVAPQVLPLWQATPLTPFAGPKPLLSYLVCPMQQLPQAQQFIKVNSGHHTCRSAPQHNTAQPSPAGRPPCLRQTPSLTR